MQHTPGHWVLESENPYEIWDESSTLVAECDPAESSVDEAEANARLIAAAPDLLAALQALIDSPNAKANDMWDAARDAIAKALGVTS